MYPPGLDVATALANRCYLNQLADNADGQRPAATDNPWGQ
ncbi:hypothetical protein HMPREF0758_1608 [Serratia odorifera DSM 4582]|uniref:Uncharacterized protein n=1 Tax=Serratia odorifera DSM 4582 TaxID=667129 RepID=D4E0A8_SEROD|nr:hypothetical protein HMPREF0758_1608 [Serratia odorifera DSM 4582]